MSKPLPSSIWINPLHFLATGFGLGSLPGAPGTWGTLAAIPIYFLLHDLNLWLYAAFVIASFVFGVFLCQHCEKAFGQADHPGIVWDEMVGLWMTLFAVPFSWTWMIVGFVLFRIFDIFKPWPIHLAEKNIPHGGLAVMLDDVIAAIYAGLILQVIVFITYRFF